MQKNSGSESVQGNYNFNLKGQMEQRLQEDKGKADMVNMVMIGGSQLGWMKDEIGRMVGNGVKVE